jgi:hypothetical protein
MKHVRKQNIFSNLKSCARYKPLPTFHPSPWLKPMNPYHNLEPSRMDPTLLDEYDKYIE